MSLESAALKSLDQIAALSADNRALAAEVEWLREVGDALARGVVITKGTLVGAAKIQDGLGNYELAETFRKAALAADALVANWHTATGGTTDGG